MAGDVWYHLSEETKGYPNMRNIKIVADSSANLQELNSVPFGVAPLKIITDSREFVDDSRLDLDEMIKYFRSYKSKSHTSCPNPEDWMGAFGDAEEVYCVAITSGLSGSFNAACVAKNLYEQAHPDRRVYVIDSLSAGPELTLIVEKIAELIAEGKTYEQICQIMPDYTSKTGLLFMLESLSNFAANGRVSPAVAKIANVLGIRIVGKASDEGTLEPTDKCRGAEKSLAAILKRLKESGLKNGKVHLAHCLNEPAAMQLKKMIEAELPEATVTIGINLGLCSYYAEKGGLLVGYEKF